VTTNDAPTDPELIRFLREELGEGVLGGGSWTFSGPIWLWRGKAKDGAASTMAWHFLTIDGEVANAIRAAAPGRTAAWGSVYVTVAIGATEWRTSVFPSKDVKGYLLPVKGSVRKAEKLVEGNVVTVRLQL
jgi:drug/metabolite transporter superfamily protein YnfA